MASFFGAKVELYLLVYTLAEDTSRTHERKRDTKIRKHISAPLPHLRFLLKVILELFLRCILFSR